MVSKKHIFDRFSSNLAKVFPGAAGQYACPLTLRLFGQEDIDQLSFEHCIPNGLGPKRFVLTEEKANNSAGSDIDAHLHRMIGHLEFIRDAVGSVTVRMQTGEVEVGADFTRDTSGDSVKNDLRIDASRSDPKAIETAQQAAERGDYPSELRLRLHSNHSFVDRRAKIALIKTAYLMMFRELGYSLILHPSFQPIRQQIANPSDDILPVDKIAIVVKENLPQPVFWVKEPEHLFAYGYDFALQKNANAKPTGFRVFLPCSTQSAEHWRTAQPINHQYGFLRPDIDYIENPQTWIENTEIVS